MARKVIGTIILLLLGSVFYLIFFSDKKEERTIKQIIEDTYQKCDTYDFSKFYNLEMLIRERGNIRDVILLSTVSYSEEELPKNIAPRSLECTIYSYGGILTIKDNEFANGEYKEYLSDSDIKALVKDFYKLDLGYLMVDYKNDVYLSPLPFSFERFFMLRVNDSTIVKGNKQLRIEGRGTYTHYKGNWYLSNFYIDKYNLEID